MPTRLADGLGLGSALREASSTIRPVFRFLAELWFPRVVLRPHIKDAMNNFGRQIVNEKNINSRPHDCQFSIQHLGARQLFGIVKAMGRKIAALCGGVISGRNHNQE